MTTKKSSLSRRTFMAGTAGAMSLPLFVPKSVLGNAENAAANDKITLGFIGVGKMAYGSHMPHFLKMPEVKVLAVCDVDTNRREAAQKRVNDAYGNKDCDAYNDYGDLLARDDIDAVVIATPDHWHALVIRDAVKAGKDIYAEKPLTNNLAEAKIVMDTVKNSEIIFQTGSQQRASENFRHACELIQNGYLGKISRVEVGVGGPPSPDKLPGEEMEPGLDWERWLGPAPMREYSSVLSPRGVHNHFPSWRNFQPYGGGGMTDWGAHHFDIAQWGLGMDESGPVEIVPPEDPKRGNGLKYIYDNGVELLHGGKSGVTFFGSEGELFVNRGKLSSTPEEIVKIKLKDGDVHLYKAPGGSHGGHRQDWINSVKSRKQPNCPIEIGARSVAVCHLGNIAYRHAEELGGKSLKWDPQEWKFVGNEAANKWQDYPYERREGYELAKV